MRAPRVLLGVALLVGIAACTDSKDGASHPYRREERPPVVDYASTPISGVPGSTTTTSVAEVGGATIVGSVSGPGGLVPAAVVRIEHLVGSNAIVHDVLTGPDGRYSLAGVPGGRYRIRAFQAPVLAGTTPQIQFIEDGHETAVDLTMEDQRKVVATAATSPGTPYVDDAVNLAVVVATRSVAPDGVVRSTPIPGLRVELDGLGAWVERRDEPIRTPLNPRGTTTTTTFVPSNGIQLTDGAGVVRYELECRTPGAPGLGLLVTVTVTPPAVEGQPPPVPEQQVQRIDLDLPSCVDPTAVTVPPSTTPRRSTTTSDTVEDR